MSKGISDLSQEEQSALLLDYVKGRTSEETGKHIESLVAKDSRLAEELAYYEGLAGAILPNKDSQPVDELAWAKISRSIDAEAVAPKAANDNTRRWQYVAAALAFMVVGQSAFYATQGPETDDRYETVSETSHSFVLQVTFTPATTEAQIRALLQQIDGEFVGGPSSLGIYEIGFKDDDQRDVAFEALENMPQLIESAFKRAQ